MQKATPSSKKVTILRKIFKSNRSNTFSAGLIFIFGANLLFFLFLLVCTPADAEVQHSSSQDQNTILDESALPTAYGEVIFRHNELSPKQLFIIGMGHRSFLSRQNGSNTSKTQAEVFRIGEWLNRHKNLQLILPEGFFRAAADNNEASFAQMGDVHFDLESQLFDAQILEQKLSDNSCYVNAEMLLIENYMMRAQQVEDMHLYDAVSSRLARLEESSDDSNDPLSLQFELNSLQELRTATMLQNIPGIIESEFRQGNIKKRFALLTIGLAHINEIIRFVDENRIEISSPDNLPGQRGDYLSDVNLVREGFGITIIIPRTLAEDREVLKVTKLEDIFVKDQVVMASP